MAVLRMSGRRALELIPIIIGITVISFLLLRLVPGDPARQILGNLYTPASGARVRKSLGLDLPLWQQYWDFVSSAAHGNFGESYFYHQPVSLLIRQRVGVTMLLILMSAIITGVISVTFGMLSGLRRGGMLDQFTRVLLLVGFAIPSFLLGVVFLLVFAVKVPAFPVSGYGSTFPSHIYHLILPSLTLALPFSTVLVRSLRSSVIDISASDFVTIARLKGISQRRIALRHILPNGLVSVVAVFGVNLAFLVGGTVIVEDVFALPGIGTLLVDSVSTRDYPVVQALTLLFALLVVAVNLLTDIVHASLDPRLAKVER